MFSGARKVYHAAVESEDQDEENDTKDTSPSGPRAGRWFMIQRFKERHGHPQHSNHSVTLATVNAVLRKVESDVATPMGVLRRAQEVCDVADVYPDSSRLSEGTRKARVGEVREDDQGRGGGGGERHPPAIPIRQI